MPKRNWYTPHEVAELEDVHVVTVRRWIRDGLIPYWRSPGGRTLRVPLDYGEKVEQREQRSA